MIRWRDRLNNCQSGQPQSLPVTKGANARPSRTTLRTKGRVISHLLILLTLVASAFIIEPASAITREQVSNALRATVQIIVPDNDFEIFSLGSGTVMDTAGLILTNNHVVAAERPNGLMNDDALAAIAVTPPDLRGESVIKYFGKIVKTDPELDLALIQIIALADDPEAPLPANLGLAPIELGNSDDLMISDEVNMFGFPGLGRNTVTYTRGTVSGFLDDDRNGIYEWIKTDAELNHGNSGGLATNEQGLFVGVPTAGNTDDVGKIGLVRTGNLALDFYRSYFPSNGGDGPHVASVQYAEAINRLGEPIGAAVQFASGITDLYAVFTYGGFAEGETLTYIWYIDGFESLRDSFQWDSGESGTSWVSVYNDEGIPDGFVELELILDGESVYRGGVVVGEGAIPDPQDPDPVDPDPQDPNVPFPIDTGSTFGAITFAENVSNDQPTSIGTTFSNLNEVFGFFDYAGMSNGTAWATRWYYNGQMVLETPSVWDSGAEGSYYVSLYHPDGLPAGDYELELLIEDELAQSGVFSIVQGAGAAPQDISVIGTVTDQDNSRVTISGALIVFLTPGATIDEWVDSDFADNMVWAVGTSGQDGNFQLDARVTPGEYYGVAVVHDLYQPIAVDDFQIPPDATDPYELSVTMERK